MAMAGFLSQCVDLAGTAGGQAVLPQYIDCLSLWTEHDYSFCECSLCQQFSQPIPEYSATNRPPDCDVTRNDPRCRNEVSMTTLTPGIASNHTLCLNHWTFLRLPTAPPTMQQSWNDPDTVESSTISAQLGGKPSNPQQLILTLDTQYDAAVERFTTVDAFVHTSETLPENWYNVHRGTELNQGHAAYPAIVWTPGLPPNGVPDTSNYVEFSQRDSFTYTMGYDDAHGATCNKKMPSEIYLAVRCGNPNAGALGSWARQAQPCRFTVRYVLVPQHLMHGDVLGPLPIAPLTTHGYSVDVGGYDVLRFSFRRIGANLTFACLTDGIEDCSVSRGGVVGTVYSSIGACPTLNTASARPLANSTHTLRQEWFCTAPGEEGRYHVALTTDELFDVGGPVPGYVLHDGSRPEEGTELIPAPGQQNNQLKPMRGYYTISVHHVAFADGPIAPGTERAGCASYGQWRTFTVVTTGPADASLFLEAFAVDEAGVALPGVGMPLSSLYVRRNKAPTKATFDVVTHAPSSSLSTSPCFVDEPYEYHIAAFLSDALRATATGLGPTLFKIVPTLLSAEGPTYGTPSWPAGAVVPLVAPLFMGGGGHVCCGQFRYWVVRGVPADFEPIIYLNVSVAHLGTPLPPPSPLPPPPTLPPLQPSIEYNTSYPFPPMPPPPSPGPVEPPPLVVNEDKDAYVETLARGARVQALFTKRLTCPAADDVLADHSGCGSRCAVSWLARYDAFSGRATYHPSTSVAGGFAPLGAEEGLADWYVGVQSLRDEPAEFELFLGSRRRSRSFKEYACTRLSHFCPTRAAVANVSGASVPVVADTMLPQSSAPSAAVRTSASISVAMTSLCCMMVLRGGRRT